MNNILRFTQNIQQKCFRESLNKTITRLFFSLFQVHIVIHVYSLVNRNTLKQLPDVNEDKVDKSK